MFSIETRLLSAIASGVIRLTSAVESGQPADDAHQLLVQLLDALFVASEEVLHAGVVAQTLRDRDGIRRAH